MAQTKRIERTLLSEQEINELLSESDSLSLLLATTKLSSGRSGGAQSFALGTGMEFDDLRHYQLGDDPKLIDWRASARSQQTLVRGYLAELQQPLFIVIDRGASMRFGSSQRLKVTQAARLAIKLMGIYHHAGYEVGGLLLNPSAQWRPATSNLDALRQLAFDTAAPCPPIESEPHDWARLFALLQQQVPAGSRLLLLSDFFDLAESAEPQLGVLAQRVSMHAVRISDPLEQQLSELEGVQLNWGSAALSPTTTEQLVDLRDALEREREVVKARFTEAGAPLSDLLSTTERFSENWLQELV